MQSTYSKDERNWAMFGHLAALLGYLPLIIGGVIGPLVIWLLRKEDMPFAAAQAKESLNFQITVLIAAAVFLVLVLVRIGIVLLALLFLVNLVCIIIAAVKSSEGVPYRYPVNLRLIS